MFNRLSFFIASPCSCFAILAQENITHLFDSTIIVAFCSAVGVGLVFLVLNRLFFHLKAPDATIGVLNSLYLNSNNIGLPIATYILGNRRSSRPFSSCSRRCSRRSDSPCST